MSMLAGVECHREALSMQLDCLDIFSRPEAEIVQMLQGLIPARIRSDGRCLIRKMKSRKVSIASLKFSKETKYCVPKDDIIREGYLFKYSSSVRKQWRARYLVLTNKNLYCYKNMADFKSFPLEVIPFDNVTMTLEEAGLEKSKMFCIKLSLPSLLSKKTHVLGCHNADNRDEWMTAILQALTSQRLDKREQERISGVFNELDGLAKRQSRSLTDLSIFSTKKAERPKSAEFSWFLNVNNRKDNTDFKTMRRAKALSLVENLHMRNDFLMSSS